MAKDKNLSKKKSSAINKGGFDYTKAWPLGLLLLVTFMVYAKSINYFITHLDDYILIFEKESFNHIGNLLKAFTVGTFGEKDIYYRPVLQITFMIEQLFKSDTLALYHMDNILLHLWSTYLVYRFLIILGSSHRTGLLLTAIYSLHPALTMAVAWIPGRNDSLLTIFTLLFFIHLYAYLHTNQPKNLAALSIFLFLALFTKETAFFIPFVAIALVYAWNIPVNKKQTALLAGICMLLLLLWFVLKSRVSDGSLFKDGLDAQMQLIAERLPRLLLYLGKVFIPVQLSNYPSAENSSIWFGLIALLVLIAIIFFTQNRNNKKIAFGLLWFVVFIIPFFLVPKGINDQVFEHRLYLPLIGLLILVSNSALCNGQLNVKYFTYAWIPLLLFYIYQISNYLPRFQNQFTFWENAVKDSPNSSYANNILAARYVSDKRIKEALPLFQKAYALNKAERYCRYFIAKEYYLPMDSVDKAISLIKEEIEINPTYVEAYFELSHIYYLQNNLSESVKYLEKCKQLRPDDPMINNNLLLTYIKLKNKAAAAQLSKFMLSKGMTVPDAALQDIEKME